MHPQYPTSEYGKIHIWLKKKYGKAFKCESNLCDKISNKFHWAKLDNKNYDFDRNNFWMLCQRCHIKYDLKGKRMPRKIKNKYTRSLIENIRLQLFLEQNKFAEILGISKSAICNYERGIRTPRLSIIKKMRELAKENGMDFSVEDFLN